MRYCAIASGSNGNCYYIANGEDAILIDVGINSKHLHLRMLNLGINPCSINAIFITHEHTDHIRGLSVFCKKYDIPVYITRGSYEGANIQLPSYLLNIIQANDRIRIGTMEIFGIPKYHDAKEPCSFVVSDGSTNVSILTDIGRVCDNVRHVVQHSDVLLLESNYDEKLLENGRYPFYLKNRIRGGRGHLSNRMALDVLNEHRNARLKHLILGHLSGENNSIEKVAETFAPYCQDIKLSIATRHEETQIFDTADLTAITHAEFRMEVRIQIG